MYWTSFLIDVSILTSLSVYNGPGSWTWKLSDFLLYENILVRRHRRWKIENHGLSKLALRLMTIQLDHGIGISVDHRSCCRYSFPNIGLSA
jgi:hypothetical protein